MSILNQERDCCLGFSYFHKIGPVGLGRLKKYFPSLTVAFQASIIDLEKAGMSSVLASEFSAWRQTFSANRAWAELDQEKIKFITWDDDVYPPLLKEIVAAPPFLYYKGIIDREITRRLAVVGSRRHSAYANKVITTLIPILASYQIEIVSGLALGVDTLAHRAILSGHGNTLAVLGSGLKNIYPRDNIRLAEQIASEGGALLSEFPPDTPPYKTNFPRRNRLISGLAQATLVVEAGAKSGALITAAYALEQNREVLAIPGPVFSEFSAGPNKLIKDGAVVVTEATDILRIFKIEISDGDAAEKISNDQALELKNTYEKTIYQLIKQATERVEKITTDEIAKMSKLDTAIINSTLSILEIREMIIYDGYGYSLK